MVESVSGCGVYCVPCSHKLHGSHKLNGTQYTPQPETLLPTLLNI